MHLGLPQHGRTWDTLLQFPGLRGRRLTTRMSGTSNAAALTSRAAIVIHSAVAELLKQPEAGPLTSVPPAVLVKALLVHTAEWPAETAAYVQHALGSLLDANRGKDHLAGLLGYGVLRAVRGVVCALERATLVGGGFIAKDQRAIHQLPIPAILHLFRGWRRLTATLAWFTPINSADRRYRIARLRMDLPKGSSSPLMVEGGQVHADATIRGTVQHTILEHDGPVISTDDGGALELAVSSSEEAGTLEESVSYDLRDTRSGRGRERRGDSSAYPPHDDRDDRSLRSRRRDPQPASIRDAGATPRGHPRAGQDGAVGGVARGWLEWVVRPSTWRRIVWES